MTELQIWLIVLGVAVVGGVLAFNKWQEHRHGKRAERTFRTDTRDVLIDPATESGERAEPSVTGAAGLPSGEPVAPPKPQPAPASPRHEAGSKRSSPGLPAQFKDAEGDYAVCLESIEPFPGTRLWARQAELFAGIGKPVQWLAFDDETNAWAPLARDAKTSHRWYCAALQLVDRNGPLQGGSFDRFSQALGSLVDELMMIPVQSPGRQDVLARAQALDQFCASVDIQIGINVVSKGSPFPGTKIRAVAEAEGFALREDGVFHLTDETGNTLFVLGNLEAPAFSAEGMRALTTQGLTLVVDVPRVPQGAKVFERMVHFAGHLADALNGAVVDDNRALLGEAGVAAIRAQIDEFQRRMAARGLQPGGALARRLFA